MKNKLKLFSFNVPYESEVYRPCGRKSYYDNEPIDGYSEAYIDLRKVSVLFADM